MNIMNRQIKLQDVAEYIKNNPCDYMLHIIHDVRYHRYNLIPRFTGNNSNGFEIHTNSKYKLRMYLDTIGLKIGKYYVDEKWRKRSIVFLYKTS